MTYTNRHNAAIDARIASDLQEISHAVVNEMGALVHSILLVGGFGRGEGSACENAGAIKILGDYDLFVCLNSRSMVRYAWYYRKHQPRLHHIAETLADRLGIKQIDLVIKHHAYFAQHGVPTLEQYEVRYGHMLLFGNEDPCDRMPEWPAQQVPLEEFIRLLRNRGMGLLMAALYMESGDFLHSQRENFILEVNKAWLAIGDLFMFRQSVYHYSYRQRLNHIREHPETIPPQWPQVRAHYQKALEFKLSPEWELFAQTDLKRWWLDTKETWLAVLEEQEAIRSGRPWNSWPEYARCSRERLPYRRIVTNLLRSSAADYRRLYQRMWNLSHPATMLASISLLLQARDAAGVLSEPVRDMAAMWKWGRIQNAAHSWSSLAKMVLACMHPQGEVARIINAQAQT